MSTDLALGQEFRGGRGGVMAYISPSRLNCWLACPLKFKFQYIDGLRLPTTPALFLGKAVHAGLEVYYRHRQLGVTLPADDVGRRLVDLWAALIDEEGMKFGSAADEEASRRQAIELVCAYLRAVPPDEKPLAVEAAIEMPLVDPATGENLGLPLLGIVDVILDSPSGPRVIDFKTSSRASEPLEIVHEIQLTSYAWLLRQVSDRPEAGLEIRSLVKTKTPKVEFHQYPARTEAHFQRLFAVVHAYLDDLDTERYLYRPGMGCGMCDFREGPCRRWQA